MKRRKFLKIAATSAPMPCCFRADLSTIDINKPFNMIWKRTLGKTGEKLSVPGFGGIVVMDATPEEALQGLRFTLSHPVTAAIPPGDEHLYKMALGLSD